jgi:hypothetical protein
MEQFISSGVKMIIGDGVTLALVLLFFFILLVVFARLDLTVGLIVLIPLVLILAAYQGFPAWLVLIIAFGMVFIVYLAAKALLAR